MTWGEQSACGKSVAGAGSRVNTPEAGFRSSVTTPSCVELTGVFANKNGVCAGVCVCAGDGGEIEIEIADRTISLDVAVLKNAAIDRRIGVEGVR